jgi:hypothetical protein
LNVLIETSIVESYHQSKYFTHCIIPASCTLVFYVMLRHVCWVFNPPII